MQLGYADGVADGTESVFQKGFDDGYESGFRNGYMLGQIQGQLYAKERVLSTDLLLKKPPRGQCQICIVKDLMNESIPHIIEIQRKHMQNVELTLEKRYGLNNNFIEK